MALDGHTIWRWIFVVDVAMVVSVRIIIGLGTYLGDTPSPDSVFMVFSTIYVQYYVAKTMWYCEI